MRRAWLMVVALAACGDNLAPDGLPLVPAPNLTIVAHPDDDLLFMQPDVAELADGHVGLTTVYVTAGATDDDIASAERRYAGVMEAYAEAAGLVSSWACGWIELAGHPAEHCRLDDARVSLVFIGYPDGGKSGEQPASLLHVWDGSAPGARTVARRAAWHDRASLIAVVSAAIEQTEPTTIRTLDGSGTHGRDHADHVIVGTLARIAAARVSYAHELLSFRGYAIEVERANVIDALFTRGRNMIAHYHACASGCASCGSACRVVNDAHETWAGRRYAIARRRPGPGVLRLDGACALVDPSGVVTLGACAGAPTARLTAKGRLQIGDRCITPGDHGELIAAACTSTGATRFWLDDEGHLWAGRAPDPSQVGPGNQGACVAAVDGKPRVVACGAKLAPRWQLETHAVTTVVRPSWLRSSGRAVRLGPLGLCAVEAGVLTCAPTTMLDDAATLGPLPIEPESLAFVIEADGPRACGRTAAGIVCARPGEAPTLWSSAFARTGPASALDRSIAGFGGELCGLDERGVACTRGGSAPAELRSAWPAPDSALWPGDLDGDGQIDWCVGSSTGASCGRAADRTLTTDGVPWTFQLGGVRDPTPTEPALGALTDVDGDGFADLCSVHERRIVCARSQRYGFGPAITLAWLPAGPPPLALWMHGPTACVDDGATISCAAPRP